MSSIVTLVAGDPLKINIKYEIVIYEWKANMCTLEIHLGTMSNMK
jgi:hypothetical protein